MIALEDFFRAAGLDEKHAKPIAQLPVDQTGRDISVGFLKAMQEIEVQALEKTRSMAASEMTMHKLATMINNLAKYHQGLRNRF